MPKSRKAHKQNCINGRGQEMKRLTAAIFAVITAGYGYVYWDRNRKRKAQAPLLGVVKPKKEMFE